MNRKIYSALIITAASILFLPGCQSEKDKGVETVQEETAVEEEKIEYQIVDVNETAPTFKLDSLDGTTYRLDEMQGKPVLLNFFSVDCPYCREKMPDLNRLYLENKDNAQVVLVNVGDSDSQVEDFKAEYKLDLPILMDEDVAVSQLYRVNAVPYTVVIDSEGTIDGIRVGPMSYEDMQTHLDRFKN